jgi:hypothetical protein
MNLNPLDHKLVWNWRSSWRWFSMQLALVGSLALGALFAWPEILLSTLNMLPAELRPWCPPLVSFVLFAVVALVRLWKQSHPGKPK